MHFLNVKFCIMIRLSRKLVLKCPIDNKWVLVPGMLGAKPLPEPVLIQFTDAYMRHKGEMI